MTDLGSILPVNSASKLCNLHVCPRSKLIGLSVCTTKAIGVDPVYEKIMLFCANKKPTDPASGKFRIELNKLYHMELKLFAKPTLLQFCIPFYKDDLAVMLVAEQSTSGTKFSVHGFDQERKVRIGEEKHSTHRDLQVLKIDKNATEAGSAFGLTSTGVLNLIQVKF